jgi:cytochrome P450
MGAAMSEQSSPSTAQLLEADWPSIEVNSCPSPYAYYEAVRSEAPVLKVPSHNHYVVGRVEDIIYVTRHPEIFSNHHSVFDERGYLRAATLEEVNEDRPWAIATSDPPLHTDKRRLTLDVMLRPSRLRDYEGMIADIVEELIDGFIDRGSCEFVTEFAEALPAGVMWRMLGLPEEDRHLAVKWGQFEGFGFRFAPEERQAESAEIVREVTAYMQAAILDRHEKIRDDALSSWIAAHKEKASGELDLASVVTDAITLMFGGLATSTHMFANIMQLLLWHPEQMKAVREDYAQIPHAVEEAVRMESPVQQTPRLCIVDTELGGVKIPAGATVLLAWGCANRDEAVFDKSDEFDIDRADLRKHVGFGHGAHFCVGAPLARLEGKIGFERLFDRLDDFRFAPGFDHAPNRSSTQHRCPKELRIEFERIH